LIDDPPKTIAMTQEFPGHAICVYPCNLWIDGAGRKTSFGTG